MKGDNEKNRELAAKLLQKLGGQLDYESIMGLDFSKFVTEVPFDLHELTSGILNSYLDDLTDRQKLTFFEKILEELKK